MANRVFVDMDGVVVDFDGYRGNTPSDEIKKAVGAYRGMLPIPGALEAVRSLIGMGFEVWMATKPPTGVPHAYADKAAWVMHYLPELKRRIIITHDKGLLGDEHDFLCDDRPHKANCEEFKGQLLRFVDGFHWPQALEYFRELNTSRKATNERIAQLSEKL
jgi:5'(3')-deoxyribonucleotidase